MEQPGSDGDLGEGDEPVNLGDEDGSTDLSTSNNEPDLTGDENIRTRSGRKPEE